MCVCVYVCLCMHIYIYVYIWTHPPTAHEITLVSRRRHWQSFLLPQRQKRRSLTSTAATLANFGLQRCQARKQRARQAKKKVTQGIGSKLERREGARPCAVSLSGPEHSRSGPKREWATGQLQTQEGLRAEAKIIVGRLQRQGDAESRTPVKKLWTNSTVSRGLKLTIYCRCRLESLRGAQRKVKAAKLQAKQVTRGGGPSREFPKQQGRAAAVGGMQASKATLERMLVQLTWAGTQSQAIVWEKTFFMHSSPHIYIKNSPEAIQKNVRLHHQNQNVKSNLLSATSYLSTTPDTCELQPWDGSAAVFLAFGTLPSVWALQHRSWNCHQGKISSPGGIVISISQMG